MSQTVENRLHFGVPIFEATLPNFDANRQALLDHVLKMRDGEAGMMRSNHGGWHSDDKLHTHEDPILQWFTREVYNIASPCILHNESPDYPGKVLLSAMWANVNESGAWNAPHTHMPCEWAGCCYISVNENPRQQGSGARDGDIMFFDPLPLGPQYRRPPTASYSPKNGNLFIFPGYLLHMVTPHFEKAPRVSIAFNFRLSDNLEGLGR